MIRFVSFAKTDKLMTGKVIANKKISEREDNSLAVVAVERDGHFDVVTVMVNFEVKK